MRLCVQLSASIGSYRHVHWPLATSISHRRFRVGVFQFGRLCALGCARRDARFRRLVALRFGVAGVRHPFPQAESYGLYVSENNAGISAECWLSATSPSRLWRREYVEQLRRARARPIGR